MALISDLISQLFGAGLQLGLNQLSGSLDRGRQERAATQAGSVLQNLITPQVRAPEGVPPGVFSLTGQQVPKTTTLQNIAGASPEDIAAVSGNQFTSTILQNLLTQEGLPDKAFLEALGKAGGRELFETLSPDELRGITVGGDFPIETSRERTALLERAVSKEEEAAKLARQLQTISARGKQAQILKGTPGAGSGQGKPLTSTHLKALKDQIIQLNPDRFGEQIITGSGIKIQGLNEEGRKVFNEAVKLQRGNRDLDAFAIANQAIKLFTAPQGDTAQPLPPLETPENLSVNEKAALNQAKSKGSIREQKAWLRKNRKRLKQNGIDVDKVANAIGQ